MFFQGICFKEKWKSSAQGDSKTKKKFICTTYGCLRFIDSIRFLLRTLDSISGGPKLEDLIITKKKEGC